MEDGQLLESFKQEALGETCACCGRPAKHMIYWGVAY